MVRVVLDLRLASGRAVLPLHTQVRPAVGDDAERALPVETLVGLLDEVAAADLKNATGPSLLPPGLAPGQHLLCSEGQTRQARRARQARCIHRPEGVHGERRSCNSFNGADLRDPAADPGGYPMETPFTAECVALVSLIPNSWLK